MDGAIQRFDCARCNLTWYRHRGTSTVCPSCGDEMAAVTQPFVALEIEAPPDPADADDVR